MMEPVQQAVSDKVLAELWSRATAAERAQDLEVAQAGYTALLSILIDNGRRIPAELCDRLARCCSRLGQPRTAVRVLVAARARMQALGDGYSVFHVNLRLADTCIDALDLESAERFLAEALGGANDPQAAGPPAPAVSLPSPTPAAPLIPGLVLDRIDKLTWPGLTAADVAKARVEASVALARYWTAIGRFGPAIAATQRAGTELRQTGTGLRQTRTDIGQTRLPGVFFSAPDADLSLVELYLECGDVAAARATEQQARARHFSGRGPHPDEAPWLAIAARRAGLEGRLSEARRSVERLAGERRGPPTRRDVWITFFYTGLLTQLNRLSEAERALDDLEARLDDSPMHAALRREIDSRRSAIRDKRADASAEEALPFVPEQVLDSGDDAPEAPDAERAPSAPPDVAPGRRKERFADEWALGANHVLRLLAAGRLDDAGKRVTALIELAARTDAPRIQTRTRYYRALFDHARGQYAAARDGLLACIDQAAEQGLTLDRLQYLERLVWTFARLGMAEEHKRYAAETKALLDSVLSALDGDDRVFWMLNRMSRQDEFVAARIASLASVKPPSFPWPAMAALLHRVRLRRETLERYREVACLGGWTIDRTLSAPEAAGTREPAAVPAPDVATESHQIETWVRAQLDLSRRTAGPHVHRGSFLDRLLPLHRIPRSVAVVHYYAVADRLFVFVLSRGRISVTTLRTTRVELYEAVREVLHAIVHQWQARAGDRRVVKALGRLSKDIGVEQVLAPLAASVEHVILVPHGVLVHAPFAALPCGEQRLCERFTLSSAPGLAFVDLNGAAGRRPAFSGRFLGVGVRDYPGTSWRSLPGAVAEVERVASLVSGSDTAKLLTGAAAQPKAILGALEEAEIAHFACHGMFDQKSPHRSRLLVSGPGGTTGEITLADIQVRKLERLKLAVLASCWTSSAAVLPGDEVVCLPAAFLRAGARAAIAPLWEVDDAASGAFMEAFYRAAARFPAARALAEVQRAWLQEDPRGRGMVFHWAAHVHHGQG